MAPKFLRTIDDVTVAWLSEVLGQPVRDFASEQVGTGQVSSTYRLKLDWDGSHETVILKLADPDPGVRRTGVLTGQYLRETEFYNKVTDRLPQQSLTKCHHAAYDADGGWVTLLLEDVAPATQGDQIEGCSIPQAELVVRELAAIVAAAADHDDLDWLDVQPPITTSTLRLMLPRFLTRYGDQLSAEERSLVEDLVARTDTWWADKSGPRSVLHGDFRLDNMLFPAEGSTSERQLTIVDWATLMRGPITEDLAYFLGASLTTEDRREHEERLVRLFHDEVVRHGVDISWEDCWNGYRWGSFSGVIMVLAASTIVSQTDRGDELFMTMLHRHAAQIADVKAMDLLGAAHRDRLTVDPANEGRHTPGTERYWNESWYLDAMSADGKNGAYVRVGYVPNLKQTVYTAWIVADGKPSVAVIDYVAPLPAEGLTVTAPAFTSTLDIEVPLKRFRVTLTGTGESYADPAAVLRGESGEQVPVSMDLVWETEGDPYMYPVATRYELPCHVSGTVTVGDEERVIEGPGQRDHSWGDRNWWALNWTWASAHLSDETRIQIIEARVPGLPVLATGYEQREGKLTEIFDANARYDIPADRMPGTTKITLNPTGTDLVYEPIAYAPLRLEAPDGRICEFPRAMARISSPDGRTGLGWIEWGHNVPAPRKGGRVGGAVKAVAARSTATATALGNKVPESVVHRLMGSRVGPRVVDALFKAMPGQLDPDYSSTVDARVRFHILDSKGLKMRSNDLVLGVDQAPRIEPVVESSPEARCALTLTAADLVLMGAERLDTAEATLDRRILIEGDVLFMMIAAPILTGPKFPQQQPLGK